MFAEKYIWTVPFYYFNKELWFFFTSYFKDTNGLI